MQLGNIMDIDNAIVFATSAHAGQVRKYTGEPYITHPLRVAQILAHHYPNANDSMIAAAILHDTVEDTDATLDDIEANFGAKVRELVYWLSDVSRLEDGNRAKRKAIDLEHPKAPFQAQIIKLADVIDNATTIVRHDEAFAKLYLREKEHLLDAMLPQVKTTDIWQHTSEVLHLSAQTLAHVYESQLSKKSHAL
jgi:(p)ppGpp synthase/HD superfamily hydrolase